MLAATDTANTGMTGKRILVVEDEEGIQELIRYNLENVGVRVGSAASGAEAFVIADLCPDETTYSVTKGSSSTELSAREFRILRHIARWKGKIFSRRQLLAAILPDDVAVEPRTVNVHIRHVRMLIEDDPANPRHIKTRRGIEYYFDDRPE